MTSELDELLAAANSTELSREARAADVESLPLPAAMRAIALHEEDADLFTGMARQDKDPRKTLHCDAVPVPEPGPNECLVAPMAAALNYNTLWSSLFEPRSSFEYLRKFARRDPALAHHVLPYHIVGSDAAGVVIRTGPGVTRWRPGDRVLVHSVSFDNQDHEGHDDGMLDAYQRAWGFETNFGAFGQLCVAQATQLLPMPGHLTWEEAASLNAALSTSYRMVVSARGGSMRQGDVVLIWGAAGGVGGFATQLVLRGGGIPVCVVSSAEKAEWLRDAGAEYVIDRHAEGYEFWRGDQPNEAQWQRFGRQIRRLTGGDDPDIVVEHVGRETFGASLYVVRRGGRVVTCASTSGYRHEYDNRHLWMSLKQIVGSHGANYREAWTSTRLVERGLIHPMLTAVYAFEDVGAAAADMLANRHTGKLGLLVNAPRPGTGVLDREKRERLLPEMSRWSGRQL